MQIPFSMVSRISFQDLKRKRWQIITRENLAAMGMKEGRNIRGQCSGRLHTFGVIISSGTLSIRGDWIPQR